MATKLEDEFDPTRINAPDAAYPAGSLKDETTPGVSDDGTPLAARVGNDWQGFSQSALAKAGIAANGQPDSVTNPQILQAVEKMYNDGDSQLAGGPIWPLGSQDSLSLGAQSTVVSIDADRFRVDTGGSLPEILYLWEPSGALPAAPFTITDISINSSGGYEFTINATVYEFLTEDFLLYRNNNDARGWGAIYDNSSDITPALNRAMADLPDGSVINTFGAVAFDGLVNLNQGTNVGYTININFGSLNALSSSSSIVIGQPDTGVINGRVNAPSGYTGDLIKVISQTINVSIKKKLTNLTFRCQTSTGTALRIVADAPGSFVSFLSVSDIDIDRFEYGILMQSMTASGVAFVNGCVFNNIIIGGQTINDIFLEADAAGTNEVSGNTFNNVQMQYIPGVTSRHLFIGERCQFNQFNGFLPWDSGGAATLLFEVAGRLNTINGFLPASGGVRSLDDSTMGLVTTDQGSQEQELLLGECVIQTSRIRKKTQTFDTADLTVLDVRDGDILIEGTVTPGTRLTNVQQGFEGQSIVINFGGNTLLSNAWGGSGQFNLIGGASRTPPDGETIEFTLIGGTWYEEGKRT